MPFTVEFAFLRFYYYTAGSGGAGPTILATSFLLLGEEVVAYNKGQFFNSIIKISIFISYAYCSLLYTTLNQYHMHLIRRKDQTKAI